MQQDK